MVFSSLTFLFAFLPITLILYYLVPKKAKNVVILISGLVFYAWGEPIYVLVMILSTFIDYTAGRIIDKYDDRPKIRTACLLVSLIMNIGLLATFKYLGFIIEALNAGFGIAIPNPNLPLPIGISFFTFQSMSYTIDIYRGQLKPLSNWLDYLFYLSFFPQLVAGPIVRARDFIPQIHQNPLRVTREMFGTGVFLIISGLFKKAIISDYISLNFVDRVFDDPLLYSGFENLMGLYGYALQIYCDFSGYSDMAIGLGAMFGFAFPENFNYPYLSKTVSEFWRRWHMTLSGWFREYLYIPMGGSRNGQRRTLFNLFVVFLATGLWHGANWQFVAWGMWYAVLLILERTVLKKPLERLPAPVIRLYTLVCVVCGWVLFRAPGLRAGVLWLEAMWRPAAGFAAYPAARYWDGRTLLLLAAGLLLCGPVQACLPRLKAALYDRQRTGPAQTVCLLALGFASLVLLVSGTYNPFIYFRF